MSAQIPRVRNWIGGEWIESVSTEILDVINPATGKPIAAVPLSTESELNMAIQVAKDAFPAWRATPAVDRARPLFKLQTLMRDHFQDLARTVTEENGKTLEEARGEVLRTIENIEVAAGIPTLQLGDHAVDIAQGIDESSIREPIGTFLQIGPFNFPSMVPWWFAPYALACGNTYVIKPSQQTPLSQIKIAELVERAGFPSGVLNIVHGAKNQSETLASHPDISGVSFVGSTPVAQSVYETATRHGKRAQCQGGANNHLVVMPDAVLDAAIPNIFGSTFGCAGQRCLAGSVLIAVGDAYTELKERVVETAHAMTIGNGLDPAVDMGPVISSESKSRILDAIDAGLEDGATLLVDGRKVEVEGHPDGYWIGPTILDDVTPEMRVSQDEIFGPVLSLMRTESLDKAIELIHTSPFGNAASIYTNSGAAAREFAQRINIGNVGINIGVAAPMAFFPFSGRKQSFFGDIHGQGHDVVRFFTDPKVVITRWPRHTDGRDPWD